MKEIGRKSLEEVFGLPELKAAVTRFFEPGPLTPRSTRTTSSRRSRRGS
jgi:hypothetical protein